MGKILAQMSGGIAMHPLNPLGNRIWLLEWGLKDTDCRVCGRIPSLKGLGFSACGKTPINRPF